MVITTPPDALPQSISVKFTKEERKDLLVRAEQTLLKRSNKAYTCQHAYRCWSGPDNTSEENYPWMSDKDQVGERLQASRRRAYRRDAH
jgi:hypothetical protein